MSKRAVAALGLGAVFVIGGAIAVAIVLSGGEHHPETVVVPEPEYDLATTFDRLRRSGLRIALPERVRYDTISPPGVRRQHPATGSPVRWGIVVELEVCRGQAGSLAILKNMPTYSVPDFTGKKLSDAVRWTEGKDVYWEADLPPLPPSDAEHLFDAYVVTGQRPTAGSELRQGIRVPRGFRPTPLVLSVDLR